MLKLNYRLQALYADNIATIRFSMPLKQEDFYREIYYHENDPSSRSFRSSAATVTFFPIIVNECVFNEKA